ncbi:unnamed protein product [Cladocopium goreaui]|uniref:Pentacotripeptide-repeat region of PRORP domain-containing protein n=1 Tax=Cladocopium goreaui TaxID=2562237 RepID=A0A9P1G7M5_9DINO|nr:unnamed protein product [Cladocopium goreaui]
MMEMLLEQVPPDVITVNSVISCGAHWTVALDMLSTMSVKMGIQADVVTYGSVISSCERGEAWRMALQTLALMQGEGVKPNVISYNSTINAVADASQWLKALELFEEMGSTCRRDVISFSALMAAEGGWCLAVQLLEQMASNSMQMNSVVFNRGISACGRWGRWETALELLSWAQEQRCADLVGYSSAIAACAIGRSWTSALALLEAMTLADLQPNEITLNAVISALEPFGLWTLALQILTNMPKQTVASFGSAISACDKAGEWEVALQLLMKMLQVRVEANVITFNSSISACAQGSQWRVSLAILSLMCAVGVLPDTVSVNSAISACAQSGSLQIAVKLLTCMSQFITSPNTITLNSAMNVCEKGIFWQASLQFLAEFRQRRLESTIISTHTAASTCIKARRWQHALESFDFIDVTLQSLAVIAWEVSDKTLPLCSALEDMQVQMFQDLRCKRSC